MALFAMSFHECNSFPCCLMDAVPSLPAGTSTPPTREVQQHADATLPMSRLLYILLAIWQPSVPCSNASRPGVAPSVDSCVLLARALCVLQTLM